MATVFLAGSLVAQTAQVSNQSLKASFSNLDKEPAPYVPDPSLGYSGLQDGRPNRPTLGAIADFQETYGLPTFSTPSPAYDPIYPVGTTSDMRTTPRQSATLLVTPDTGDSHDDSRQNLGKPGGTRTRHATLDSVTCGDYEQTEPIKPIIQAKAATCQRH
jgi:hypothetical protein